ncbi:MAG: class III extradiol ring-cleavage dioxygenase, partial [Bacillota bacterium]|nr:class III extradiol ring-cleavage dioxygenase [Bacillota bacterium]
ISVNPFLTPEKQYEIGKVLRGLGEEDILVVGSGVTVHNLRLVNWEQIDPEQWAIDFDNWLIDKIQQKDLTSLFNYEKLAPHASRAVPRPEHFVPLFLAMGSSNDFEASKVIHRSYDFGTLSYLCLQF